MGSIKIKNADDLVAVIKEHGNEITKEEAETILSSLSGGGELSDSALSIDMTHKRKKTVNME